MTISFLTFKSYARVLASRRGNYLPITLFCHHPNYECKFIRKTTTKHALSSILFTLFYKLFHCHIKIANNKIEEGNNNNNEEEEGDDDNTNNKSKSISSFIVSSIIGYSNAFFNNDETITKITSATPSLASKSSSVSIKIKINSHHR